MGSGLRPPSHRRSFVLVAWVPGRFNAQWAHCFTFFYGCGPNGARECGFAAQRSEVGSLCLAPFVRLLVQRSCTYRTLTGVTKSHFGRLRAPSLDAMASVSKLDISTHKGAKHAHTLLMAPNIMRSTRGHISLITRELWLFVSSYYQ